MYITLKEFFKRRISQVSTTSAEAYHASLSRSAWTKQDNVGVYVRICQRLIPTALSKRAIADSAQRSYRVEVFDIANVNVEERYMRRGRFTRWYAEAEQLAREAGLGGMYAENVLNPDLHGFFLRRGFKAMPDTVPTSYYKDLLTKCPHCGRDLDSPEEWRHNLCTSDDCSRHDKPTQPNVQARCGKALVEALGISSAEAFAVGVDDGFEQGFELPVVMTYDDPEEQWAYDTGTHIGACLAVRGGPRKIEAAPAQNDDHLMQDLPKLKYAVFPGFVCSETDGEKHFIGHAELMRLYKVDPAECMVISERERDHPGLSIATEGMVRLVPQFRAANYKLKTAGPVNVQGLTKATGLTKSQADKLLGYVSKLVSAANTVGRLGSTHVTSADWSAAVVANQKASDALHGYVRDCTLPS